jgi:pimeloyl-ACP methyl ester carboxylesterase
MNKAFAPRQQRRHPAVSHCRARVQRALTDQFRGLPLLTIFGERNDPFGFQRRWKSLFSKARQVVVPGGHHFPMCDDPALVATSINTWYRDVVAA